jgi:hypothetical protein
MDNPFSFIHHAPQNDIRLSHFMFHVSVNGHGFDVSVASALCSTAEAGCFDFDFEGFARLFIDA